MVGKTLGHYKILEPLGAGGMGEVYRARDTKLDRDVAIKVLPEDFATDQDRLARFLREAKLLASLNHANIAAIYGLEDEGDQRFIVMEVVEGETLAERIATSGCIEVDEALDIARQVAEALEAAHENGVIHRDLKPANVKVTPDGKVKVLDFGLAKAYEVDGSPSDISPDLSHSPTMAVATRTGVILGTAAYMSPEQAKGKPLDKRSDIFSFGCVLFEMLAGTRPFAGDGFSEIVAAILKDQPDWDLLPAATPSLVQSLARRCLRKDPNRRLHDIADARIEIEEALDGEAAAPAFDGAMTARPRPSRRLALPRSGLVAIGMMAAAVAGVAVERFMAQSEPTPAMHIAMALPSGLNPSLGWGPSLAISPDGQTLAYVLQSGATTMLYVKRLEELEARPLPGTEGARTPFFSPLGRWIAFFDLDDRKLKKVSLTGGEPAVVADAGSQWGATWAPDDTILFTSEYSGLVRVSADGGTPEPLTGLEDSQALWPTLLPGGEVVLFTMSPARGSFEDAVIAAVPIAGGDPQIVLESAYYPHYSPTGHLIYVQGDAVLAAPFDAESLRVTGPAATVLEGVWTSSWTGYADFAFSDNGTLVYVTGGPDPTRATLVSVDRDGTASPLVDTRRTFRVPRLSPDGRQLALTIADEPVDIWTLDLLQKRFNRLTDSSSWDAYPLWHPTMDWVAFSSTREGQAAIYKKDRRSEAVENLVATEHPTYPGSWSRDGELLAYWEDHAETGSDIWVYSLEARSREVFLDSPYNEARPEFSPDGRFIAYESNETGSQLEIYVRPYPERHPRLQVSTNGGISPRWRRDGKELFYLVGGKLMVADIETEPELVASPPLELFEGFYGGGFDVAADGQSFVMVSETVDGDPPIVVAYIPNWFQKLKQLMPVSR